MIEPYMLPAADASDDLPTKLMNALAAVLAARGGPQAHAPLERLRDKGLAHDHVRLVGTGMLARVPKQSQMKLAAQANLDYQAACFQRAAASGHTPRLVGVLPVSNGLPRGALLVEEIEGRSAALPGDLSAIAQSLASLHALALPPASQRVPLLDGIDPLRAMLQEIEAQGAFLASAGVDAITGEHIAEQIDRLRRVCAQPARPPRHLIAFDGHPGNFIVRADGAAVLVDLEKCRYSYAGFDLAHATLYTSTTWDIESYAVLGIADVERFYAVWEAAVGASAALSRPWHGLLRRAMWLWSVTWCAKWRATSSAAAQTSGDGEDWSTERSDAALVAHVRERVHHYLRANIVAQILAECDALERTWAA